MSGFDFEWLNTRFAFDQQSLNGELMNKVVSDMNNLNSLIKIVDLGAGTGSGFFHLFPKFSLPQQWTFIEKDKNLLQPTEERLQEFCQRNNFKFNKIKNKKYEIISEDKFCAIEIVNQSIQNAVKNNLFLGNNLITAFALFDLFTKEELINFVQKISPLKIPLYFVLNFSAMEFFPSTENNEYYSKQYEGHMQREKQEGRSLGKEAVNWLPKLFKKQNWEVVSRKGKWQIDKNENKMMWNFKLNFMKNALEEMPLEKTKLKAWLEEKFNPNLEERIEVYHKDFYFKYF